MVFDTTTTSTGHTHFFCMPYLCPDRQGFGVSLQERACQYSVGASVGVGRFGSGLVLVWSGLSRLSVCLSSCPLPGLRLRLARDAQAKFLAYAIAL